MSYRYDGFFTWGKLLYSRTVSYQDVSDPKSWVTNIPPSGLTRYAPYAGIAIDPYSGPRPHISYPDVSYPSWALPFVIGAANNGTGLIRLAVDFTGAMRNGQSVHVDGVQGTTEANGTWTIEVIDGNHIDLLGSAFVHAYTGGGAILTQYNRFFSSVTTIENITIDGFFVGVAVQPCDADGNGDFTTIRNSQIMNCSYGVSVGNTQSRNVGVSDSQFQYVHTIFSTDVVGRQNGRMGGPIMNCSASQIYQLFSFPNAGTGPVVFESFYVEEIVRLGVADLGGSNSNPIIFNGCTFFGVGGFTDASIPHGELTRALYNVVFYEGEAPLTFNSSDVSFYSHFGLVTGRNGLISGRTGAVLIRNSALQASGYEGHITTDAQKLAYNYLLGGAGVLAEDRSLEGMACVVPLEGLPDPMPSLPVTDGFTNIASGRSQIHR